MGATARPSGDCGIENDQFSIPVPFSTLYTGYGNVFFFLVNSFTMFMAEQFMGQICAAATDYNHNLMSGCVILTWCIPFKRYIPFLWTFSRGPPPGNCPLTSALFFGNLVILQHSKYFLQEFKL